MSLKNLGHYERMALYEQLGTNHTGKLHQAQVRAERLERNNIPDGAKEYAPIRADYVDPKYFGPHTLRMLKKAG